MLLQEEREEIVEYGKRMSGDRLAAGTSGNISIYNAEKGWMAISLLFICKIIGYCANPRAKLSNISILTILYTDVNMGIAEHTTNA